MRTDDDQVEVPLHVLEELHDLLAVRLTRQLTAAERVRVRLLIEPFLQHPERYRA